MTENRHDRIDERDLPGANGEPPQANGEATESHDDSATMSESGVANHGEPVQAVEDQAMDETELEIEALRVELEKQRSLAEEYLAGLQRLQADFTNYRRRTLAEQKSWTERAVGDFLNSLLPVIDNLDRALESARQHADEEGPVQGILSGLEMIAQELHGVLRQAGVERIEAENSQFDPNRHEALMQQETDEFDDNEVMAVFQQGYELGSRVLRPARVMVARNPAGSKNKDPQPEKPKGE